MKMFTLLIAELAATLILVEVQAGGLAFDAAGNLYVADGDSVSKYAPDGTKSPLATKLRTPLGLCLDGKGNLFVSDLAATDAERSILKIGPDGIKSTFVTGISSVGMACDRSGNLFVSQGDSIFRFTPEGVKSTFVSDAGNPSDLAFDATGNLFVVDYTMTDARLGRSILKFGPDGTKSTFVYGLHDPSNLAVDAAGNVYVTEEVTAAETPSHAILKFGPDGTESTFTSALSGDTFCGLAVDRSGDVFLSNLHSIVKFDSSGTATTFASKWVSPDKQWEYKLVDGNWPGIVKAGTTQIVLDLSQELEVPNVGNAEVIWAPDSKRFAFNYSPPHAHHTSYDTVAFYQLRGDKWVALHSLVNDTSGRSQLVQLAKGHLPKGANLRHCTPDEDILKLRNWTDAKTAILYAPCYGPHGFEAAFLFTLKYDDTGNSKIVKMQRASQKEIEEVEQ